MLAGMYVAVCVRQSYGDQPGVNNISGDTKQRGGLGVDWGPDGEFVQTVLTH